MVIGRKERWIKSAHLLNSGKVKSCGCVNLLLLRMELNFVNPSGNRTYHVPLSEKHHLVWEQNLVSGGNRQHIPSWTLTVVHQYIFPYLYHNSITHLTDLKKGYWPHLISIQLSTNILRETIIK